MKQSKTSALAHEFPMVTAPEGERCYGGAQQYLPGHTLAGFGCGLIASANLLTYLARFHAARDGVFDRFVGQQEIPMEEFNAGVLRLRRGLMRPIPGLGLTGFAVAFGLNGIFRRAHIPLRAAWGVRGKPMWERAEAMLAADLPVIFAVGPNFPCFWRKNKLTFYRKRPDGTYAPAAATCGHFVTITELDAEWARISSWGSEYYVNRKEYDAYVAQHSNPLFSNILLLKPGK